MAEPGNPRFARLTPAQCEQIHHASLQILEWTGVRLFDQAAIELITKAGAQVDGDRVRIPARLVEHALTTVPRSLTLYDRLGKPVIQLEDYHTYFGPGSDVLNIVDHRTWERRKPLLQDVRDGITVCDALSHIDFVMSMFLPGDVDNRIADRYQMEVMLNHTTKPIVIVTYEMSGSLAQLVICDEIVSFVKSFLQPVEIDDETLALDLIDQLGPDGSFLNTDHTRRHFRERWYPNLIERFNYGQWQAKGGKTLAQRAADRVDRILSTHKPPPLSEDAAKAIHAIVERAQHALTN